MLSTFKEASSIYYKEYYNNGQPISGDGNLMEDMGDADHEQPDAKKRKVTFNEKVQEKEWVQFIECFC